MATKADGLAVTGVRAPQLQRSLGRIDVALYFIVSGSSLQWLATAAAAGPSSIVVWIIGGLALFVPIGVVVVSLSSRFPEEGGMYVWTRRAFGPFAGFLTGWSYWTSNMPYFAGLLYFTAANGIFVVPGAERGMLATSPTYFLVVSLVGLAFGTIVNILGLDIAKWLNNIGAVTRQLATLLLVALAAVTLWRFGPATHFGLADLRPGVALKDVIFWSVIALAWTGPESLPFMAGEVRDPRRSIPGGLAVAAPVIAVIYIVGTLAVLVILKPTDINASSGMMQAVGSAAARIGWAGLTPVAALLVAVSCVGSVGAWLGSVARIPFVAGIDHYLPPQFGRLHPRWNSPVTALVAQSVVAAVIVVLGQGGTTIKGAYDVIVSTTVLITMLPFLLLFAAAIKLTFEQTGEPAIVLPGGRAGIVIASGIGFITTGVAMVLAAFPADDEPNKVLAVIKIVGLAIVLVGAGVTIYAFGDRRRRLRGSLPVSVAAE